MGWIGGDWRRSPSIPRKADERFWGLSGDQRKSAYLDEFLVARHRDIELGKKRAAVRGTDER
jgi:hypothetical protein